MGIEIFRIRNERLGIVLTFLCLLLFPASALLAETPVLEPDVPFYEWFIEGLETGVTDPIGARYYVKDGFRAEGPGGNLKFKIGGEVRIDGGYIGANDILKRTFADLTGRKQVER